MNRFFKTCLSLVLAIMVIISCSTSFGAAFANETNDIIVTDDTITVDDNEIIFSSYNITKNYPARVALEDTNEVDMINFHGIECIDKPEIVESTPDTIYEFCTRLPGSGGGGHSFTFDDTAGVYRKIRLKLSRYDYFNEDGSRIQGDFNYHFGDTEYVGTDSYYSSLIIVSGAAINFVVPDENGFVEFYTSTNIGKAPSYYTTFGYTKYTETSVISGGGGGVNGGSMKGIAKGCVKNIRVAIGDATEIQFYISQLTDFDIMKQYQADVDCNNEINILDATRIQLHLAKIDY